MVGRLMGICGITTDLIDMKRISKYFKNHINKLENLSEKGKFFERQFAKTDSRNRKSEESYMY